MIQDARGDIDYDEQGSGPAIPFVPGYWGTRSAWRGVITALDNQFRIITTSCLGYGGTAEHRTANDFSIEREAEIASGTASGVFRRDASVFVSSQVCMMHAR